MIKVLITAGVVFFSGLTALPAQADVNGDLNGFFNNLGYSGNVTQAQAWQGQAAGYFSGTPSKMSSWSRCNCHP